MIVAVELTMPLCISLTDDPLETATMQPVRPVVVVVAVKVETDVLNRMNSIVFDGVTRS